jgi:hypothetical protein
MPQSKGSIKEKKLAIFDLDGTLTPSKSAISPKTARLLVKLLGKMPVAVIGGGHFKQFQKQLVAKMPKTEKGLENLFLFPANSTSFFRLKSKKWKKIYGYSLPEKEKRKIFLAFEKAFKENKYEKPKKVYGQVIEDRDSQITFSALGQKAPIPEKKKWNKNKDVRQKLMKSLRKGLPGFEVRSGGLTSIDVTRKGIDKAYGVKKIKSVLKIPIKKMIFVGDALYPGGNDYAAKKTGIDCLKVSGPKDTESLIVKILNFHKK